MDIYVGNLPYDLEESELSDVFGSYGAVESVKIIKDFETGRSKGFAFVVMTNDEEAQQAIDNLSGSELGGRPLKVNAAQPKTDRPRKNFDGGGRGGYRGGREGGGGGYRGGREGGGGYRGGRDGGGYRGGREGGGGGYRGGRDGGYRGGRDSGGEGGGYRGGDDGFKKRSFRDRDGGGSGGNRDRRGF